MLKFCKVAKKKKKVNVLFDVAGDQLMLPTGY